MSNDLARLFSPDNVGAGVQLLMGGTCTAWDPVAAHSTVVVGTVAYTDLPILSSALATMSVGLVLLIKTDRGPLILGRLTVPI